MTEPKGGKVFGVGLSRTGTSSLTKALTVLGYRTSHYPSSLGDLAAHDAATDIPVTVLYKTADRLFPRSRFIWTERDLDSWLESCRYHYEVRWPQMRAQLLKDFSPAVAYADEVDRVIYGTTRFDAEIFAQRYRHHREDVLAYFKNRPEDLLVINLCADPRWEPLCTFLDKPVPAEPFPAVNDPRALPHTQFPEGDGA